MKTLHRCITNDGTMDLSYIYIYIYIYIHIVIGNTGNGCPPPSPPRRSQIVFPFQATSLITVQVGDRPRGNKSYPNSRQRLDAKCSYGFLGTPGPKQ